MVHEFVQKLRPEDRVLFVGDTKQHESIEAGRIFAEMREAGMGGTTLSHIVRQRNSPELKAVVENVSAGNIDTAVKLLSEQNRVHEFENKNERYAAIAKEYVASTGRTLIVSPDNESRQALNKAVREQLQLIGPEFKQQVLVARQDLTKEDRKVAGAYHVDDVIKFHKNNKTVGVEKGDYLTVVAVDQAKNLITVKHGEQLKAYDPARAYGVQVYQRAERAFAGGERVQLTAPWRSKGIANRETGTLESVDEKGNVTLRLDKDERRVRFNVGEMKHFDYGYAVTSFSSQGTTVEKVLVNVSTQDSRVHKLIDQRFAYVSISRAEMDAQIFTDHADKLAQALSRTQDKHQALDPSEMHRFKETIANRIAEAGGETTVSRNEPAHISTHRIEQQGQSLELGM